MSDLASTKRLFDRVTNSGPLLEQSKERLKQAIELSPNDISLWQRLGEVYRQQGHFERLLSCCEEVLRLDPNHQISKRLMTIFTNQDLVADSTNDGAQPIPFVLQDNFLTDTEENKVWQCVEENQQQFLQAQVSGSRVNLDTRQSHVLHKNQLGHIGERFINKIEQTLPQIFSKLAVDNFTVGQTELQLTMHVHGDFFRVHRDSSAKEDSLASRQVTFVYYFYQPPKQFEGGDLLLFDTDGKANAYASTYTRIVPVHNSVIFFPSCSYHQVTPVMLQSDDFRGGRFTLNGWLHPKD
ncbi:MAG: 2OG-Fe(II) oxygenase [Chloroflexota bacterium]